jgi:hypothetical protein
MSQTGRREPGAIWKASRKGFALTAISEKKKRRISSLLIFFRPTFCGIHTSSTSAIGFAGGSLEKSGEMEPYKILKKLIFLQNNCRPG